MRCFHSPFSSKQHPIPCTRASFALRHGQFWVHSPTKGLASCVEAHAQSQGIRQGHCRLLVIFLRSSDPACTRCPYCRWAIQLYSSRGWATYRRSCIEHIFGSCRALQFVCSKHCGWRSYRRGWETSRAKAPTAHLIIGFYTISKCAYYLWPPAITR